MKTKMKIKTILLFVMLLAVFYFSYILIYIISDDCYEQYEQVNRFSPSTKYLELPIPLPRVNIPVPICLVPIYNIIGSVALLSSLLVFKISMAVSVLMSLWICGKFVNNEKLNQKLEIKKRLSWKKYIKYIIIGIGIMWFALIIAGNIIAIDRSKIVGNYEYQVFRNRILKLENIISKEEAVKIANETETVNKFLELYPNIKPSVDFKGYSGNSRLPGERYKFITNAWYIVFKTEFKKDNFYLEIVIDINGKIRHKELMCQSAIDSNIFFNNSSWYITHNKEREIDIIDLFSDRNFCNVEKNSSIIINGDKTADWKIYKNKKYGFEITLIDSWKGFSTITESWKGTTLDGNSIELQGPKILLRNPNWTEINPYWQDIPILIFTKQEWQLIEAENLSIFAAPIGPIKLGENQQYVFALPPRWVGFSDTLGQDEARQIAETFKAFQIKDEIADWKTYRNEEFGFEVKYPEEAEYVERKDQPKIEGIVFIGNGYGITVDIMENPQNLSAEKWYSQYYKSKKEESKDFPFFLSPKGEHTKLNIYSVYKTADFGVDHIDIYYFISRNNYIYKVHYNEEKANDPNWDQHEEIINQMLSTFKFIETDKTLDWKTYKKGIFTLKYPSEIWNLKDERLFHKEIGDSCAIIPGGLWRQSLIKIVESTGTIFNGYEARQVKLGNENDVSIINVYFDTNLPGKEFSLYLPKDKQDKQACENDFKEVLSTIKFEK